MEIQTLFQTSPITATKLKTIKNPNIAKLTRQTHEVQIPPLCPKTGNPIDGSTLTIAYAPEEELLELYSLNEYVASFIGSDEVRDLEQFTQVVARDCHEVLGVKVAVTGKFVLNIGQTLVCECES
jgi:NADPH-dependent 7-cyano-7-deazaguanine reductase QueF